VTQPAVTSKVHQALDIHAHLAPKVAFDTHIADVLAKLFLLSFGQILDLRAGINAGHLTQLVCARAANPIYLS
jgi:hypothetical protein